MQNLPQKAVIPVLLGLLSACAIAQMPGAAAVAPQYSDADKKKIAEIEQRPEVKDEIQAQWDDTRRRDLSYIYNINSSAHFNDLSGPEFATFTQ